jgi:thiol-disulfide isomerase/thioredoxin
MAIVGLPIHRIAAIVVRIAEKIALGGLLASLLLVWLTTARAAPGAPEPAWFTRTATGEPRILLYFFWTRSCPHCRQARPFVEALPAEYPWLELRSHDISRDMAAGLLYTRLAEALGQQASSVPALLFCGTMQVGFDRPETTGQTLRRQLEDCYRQQVRTSANASSAAEPVAPVAPAAEPALDLPLIGAVDPGAFSLPALTLVLAGLDAFNPCAFFVLLFLLSLLVHARDRARMLLIGGVFVLFSGAVYFVFMAAWLNLFLLLGELRFVTLLAGLLAVVMGGLNVKDCFALRQGPSLSIPEAAKPGLFKRMRGLVSGERLPALLAGTVALAIVANSYELLCTAGFPMVYTRALTLHQLSAGAYYLYLLFYNLIYVLPLLAIVLVFAWTLGARKLQEREGRLLKLLSGTMMAGLGVLLLLYPEGLSEVWVSLGVIAGALALTGLAAQVEKRYRSSRRRSESAGAS